MKKYNSFILVALMIMNFPGFAVAASLDELYRDVIKSDNEGYLPMFVKNRNTPDILEDDDVVQKVPEVKTPEAPKKPEVPVINLVNERKLREEAEKVALEKWNRTILAVQENRVTPLDLEEIMAKVHQNDAKAVEILAWMNTRGVGLPTNLIEAFKLYQDAAKLGVPKASENAALVYKAMSKQQREDLIALPEK